MQNDEEIKKIVKEKYDAIAQGKSSCCSPVSSCCGGKDSYVNVQDNYESQKGYVKDADLGLGCGIPTDFANIKEGDTVVDLGSGAGNDVFVARAFTGAKGKVIGIDMTESMIEKALQNIKKTGFDNVDFRLGEIENIPVDTNMVDVVISNCVLNLVPNKEKAFAEIYRILKPGGHFCISDIVYIGEMPEAVLKSAAAYAGCIAGALKQDEYISVINKTGFKGVEIKKTKTIDVPDYVIDSLEMSADIKIFRENGGGIFSITVVGTK